MSTYGGTGKRPKRAVYGQQGPAAGRVHGGSKRAKGEGPRAGYDDKRYRLNREILKRTAEPICWVCRQPIDLQLPYPHPLSWSCDHVHPRSHLTIDDPRQWHLSALRPAHFRCNSSRGNRPVNQPPASNEPAIEW